MRRLNPTLLLATGLLLTFAPAYAQNDRAGSQDYPGLTRMPDTFIDGYQHTKFDSYAFPIKGGAGDAKQTVEGQMYDINYYCKRGVAPQSALQIVRNYQNAVTSKGGTILLDKPYGNGYQTTLRFRKDAAEVWLSLNARTCSYELIVVEKQAMEQQVALDAQAMASSISNTGSVAIYGIYFDTAKSDLKPESQPAIDEIVKLLTNNAALRVGIVGHTDMVGEAAMNLKLSSARAQSVIAALVQRGIAAHRLVPFGAGPWAPVASNKTDEGRAKNRRVELVEIATK